VKPARSRNTFEAQRDQQLDDIMIQDPFCETYFPKRNGFYLRFQGNDFLFCSENCRDRFVALNTKKA
jgi:uncharacterized protein